MSCTARHSVRSSKAILRHRSEESRESENKFSPCYPGMGDMKTPDFDDLLAAFDIPDIDAKEAIQSAPEEAEGHHIGAGGVAGKSSGNGAGVGGNGGSLLRPASSPDHHHHSQALAHSSQGDPSVVSVIVKNRVRPDTFGEAEVDVDKDGMAGSGEVEGGGGGRVVMGPRIPGLVSEPLVHNGFEATTASMDATLSQAQGQSNGDLWAPCSPKIASEGGGNGLGVGTANTTKQSGNIFNRLKPLIAQNPGDPMGKVRKMLLLQQQQQQQQQHQVPQQEPISEGACRSKASAACDPGSSLVPGMSVGISSSFFPSTMPMHSSSHTVGSHLSHSGLNEGMSNPSGVLSPTPLPTSQPFNGAQRGGFPHLELEDEDSEPDLGSPLVIQESPDSPACTPPKFPRHHRSPQIFNTTSVPPSSSTSTYIKTEDIAQSLSPPLQTTAPQSWHPTPAASSTVNSTHEEIKSEHVIEERDSPESPEPEMPYSALSSSSVSAASGRSSSAAVGSIPLGKEEMDGGKGGEAGDISVLDGTKHVKAEVLEGERSGDEKMEVEDREKFDTRDADGEKPPSQVAIARAVTSALTPGTPSRPLKVRIKTIKTSTGGITRTVTRVAPKGAGSAAAKGSDSKGQTGGRKVATKPKKASVSSSGREGSSQQQGAKGSIMPVSTLQDASTAMLLAASKVQNKMAATSSEKTKVSATAVSITRTAALPSISSSSSAASSPKFGVGTAGVSVRPVAQKVVNGGTATAQISKPASIVNSTGAVISRSQSSLVEAFNKILNSKNLLPSYRPDLSTPLPPEWSLPLPANGYRCLECGDAFALERSLARHYDRRSLRIEVTCNHCAKRLVFFNKCSLLLHAREHKERGLVMQCSHLVMRPVSIEQMIGQQDTTPIGVLSPSLSSPSLTSPSSVPGAASLAAAAPSSAKEEAATQPSPGRRVSDGPQVLLPLPCKKGEELQYNDFKCPECHTQFGVKAELVAHFQEVRAASNTSCMLCSPAMMLPNACSASAHQRIHKHRSPHVCPECGGVARQAIFQTHLEEACLHFARRIGYRCSSCQVVFGGLNSIKSHIQTAHCEVFHKCPSCPMAFKSGPMAQAHISTQHPTLGPAQAKMIYKCVMCDTVFTQKPLLYVHFDTHLAKQKVHVFKCPDCTKLYAQKGSMMEHIKTSHRGLSAKQEAPAVVAATGAPAAAAAAAATSARPKTESSDGEDWAGEQEEEQEEDEHEADQEHPDSQAGAPEAALPGVSGAAPSEWSCRQCETRYTEREAYISHMRKEHGKSMKKFPCRMCERSFCSAPSLRRHVRVNHEGIRRVFHCQFCTEGKRTFSSRLILEKHIQVQHGIRARDQEARQSLAQTRKRAESAQIRSDGADNSSEQEGGRSTLGAGSGEEDTEGAAGSGGEELAEGGSPAKRARGAGPVPEDTAFRCVPCGFCTEDKQEFLQHIPQHRTDGGSLQCSQCGACFTSVNSLSRHRFITHRVRDAPDPAGSATQARSPAGADLASASSSPGSPATSQLGQDAEGRVGCRVCGRRFDKASDLNTHFRTHGMAFITAHKTDKPA
ncbi:zinc finger protein 687-like [Arapaima gigas]